MSMQNELVDSSVAPVRYIHVIFRLLWMYSPEMRTPEFKFTAMSMRKNMSMQQSTGSCNTHNTIMTGRALILD
jgi:hypothetical protein